MIAWTGHFTLLGGACISRCLPLVLCTWAVGFFKPSMVAHCKQTIQGKLEKVGKLKKEQIKAKARAAGQTAVKQVFGGS